MHYRLLEAIYDIAVNNVRMQLYKNRVISGIHAKCNHAYKNVRLKYKITNNSFKQAIYR